MDDLEKLKDPKYAEAYSEPKLFDKIMKYAKATGLELIYVVLLLFYSFMKPTTPVWAKTVIVGALGYFILPVDVIPDAIPVAGYTDDFGVLLAALLTVAFYIDEDTKVKAKVKLHDWFGDYDEISLNSINKQLSDKKEKESK